MPQSGLLTPENTAHINSLIGTKLSSGRQVYIRCGALSHPCTGGGIDFFFFCRKNICLSALQRNSHQDTQRRGTQRKVAEEEESKLTECSIKNAHLRYMSQEHLGETIGIFLSFFILKLASKSSITENIRQKKGFRFASGL